MPASITAISKNLSRVKGNDLHELVAELLDAHEGNLHAVWSAFTARLVAAGEGHRIPGTVGDDYRRAAGLLRARRTKAQKIIDDAHAEALADALAAGVTIVGAPEVKATRKAAAPAPVIPWDTLKRAASAHGIPTVGGRVGIVRDLAARGADVSAAALVAEFGTADPAWAAEDTAEDTADGE